MALVAAGSNLYARLNLQNGSAGYPVWRSPNGGITWKKPQAPLPFLINSFVQHGRGNAGAPGGYVYALQRFSIGINLLRVPAGSVPVEGAYEYFSGTAAQPSWSRNGPTPGPSSPTQPVLCARASPTCPRTVATCWRSRIRWW